MDNQAFDLLKSSLEDIRQDVRDIKEELSEHKDLLIRNTLSLEDHIKRTNILQAHVANLQDLVEKFERRIAHVDNHVDKVNSIIKALTPTPKKIAAIFAALTAMLGFFTSFREFVIKVLSDFFR